MAIDMKLVALGRKEPRDGIAAQIEVLVELARKAEYAPALDEWGWPPSETDALAATGVTLSDNRSAQAEARDASKLATADQNAAFSNGKQLKRRLDRAVRSVFRRHDDLPVSEDAFEVGGTIRRSVPKLLAYFTKVEPHVAKIADKLKPRMGNIDPVAAVKQARIDLQAADTAQEVRLQDLPLETLEVYEAKGRAMLLIADLIDAAHNAFEEQAHIAALFNKDLIVRARKQRPAGEKKEAPAA